MYSRWIPRARRLQRSYSQQSPSASKSRHAQWYSDMVPGMLPIALIGSTVYMTLQLVRTNLSHEQYLEDARARVQELETKLEKLQQEKVAEPSPQTVKRFWLF